ncbi:hypothetical protein E2C01_078528 [Portunus trituberculatus]|uniref:Uncharacterized protein n=1 Tax=Portunus trituberculatus TaxID=210409 RepID=A0A5B7IEJ5_PORTR|nr:hypothetical protein [Portunus trituberculatus]
MSLTITRSSWSSLNTASFITSVDEVKKKEEKVKSTFVNIRKHETPARNVGVHCCCYCSVSDETARSYPTERAQSSLFPIFG